MCLTKLAVHECNYAGPLPCQNNVEAISLSCSNGINHLLSGTLSAEAVWRFHSNHTQLVLQYYYTARPAPKMLHKASSQ